MILNKEDVLTFLKEGEIEIENFIPKHLGPVSYDLTISDKVRYICNYPDKVRDKMELGLKPVDITKPTPIGHITELPTILNLHDALVFTTNEVIKVSNCVSGIVYARSSLTKLPILFNIPGLIDPGFKGSITGVMYNLSGRRIEIKRMRICQVVFHGHNPCKEHYGNRVLSKNQGQVAEESLISRTDKEFKS